MSERIDHAAEAIQNIKGLQGFTDGATLAWAFEANVHATLALVEQQRIANIIALTRIETENTATPTDALDAIYNREEPEVWGDTKLHTRPEIKEALGLS